MLLVRGLLESSPNDEVLLTGAGDGVVKLWRLEQGKADVAPTQMAKLQNNDSVLSVAVDGSFLYCGLAGGALNIWNLDSHQLVKRITAHTGDLWAVDIIHGMAVCGDSNGIVKVRHQFPLLPYLPLANSIRNSIHVLKRSAVGPLMKEPC
jgi:di- and tripeptidase